MTDEAAVVRAPTPAVPFRARLRAGLRRPSAWMQLARFAVVGVSGYFVNIAVFALAVHGAGIAYPEAATLAFLVAVSNNFLWHRHWTFRARDHGAVQRQAGRFLVVSVIAFLAGLGLLALLVEAFGVSEVPAQAMAIVAVTPLSFLANKLWSFRR